MLMCPVCHRAYNKDELEYLLLDVVQKNAMAYTIQDLQCGKCSEVIIIIILKNFECNKFTEFYNTKYLHFR